MSADVEDAAWSLLQSVADSPTESLRQVPVLLNLLEHEETELRISAAWALCLVVESHPDVAEYLAGRIDDRDGPAADLARRWIETRHDVESVDEANAGDTRSSGAPTAGSETAVESPTTEAETPAGSPTTEAETTDGSSTTGAETTGGDQTPDDSVVMQSAETNRERSESGPTGTDSDWRETDPLVGDTSPEESDPIGADQVVVKGQFMGDLNDTPFLSISIDDGVEKSPYAKTYAGEALLESDERQVLIRTMVPPAGVQLTRFGRYFDDALSDWSRIDDHDHVLSVLHWDHQPNPWMVLDYVPETLRKTDPLSTTDALRSGLDIASAIARAHEAGVTHLTLDPRSVAVDYRDLRPEPRLLNFGIATTFREVGGPLPVDPRYAAPEYHNDAFGQLDWMTDVYHVGGLLYTMLTGRPPYDHADLEHGAPAAVDLVPPTEIDDDLPPAVDQILAKALSTYKISRYETADELARDLRGLLDRSGGDG